jgi:hypothetical protein
MVFWIFRAIRTHACVNGRHEDRAMTGSGCPGRVQKWSISCSLRSATIRRSERERLSRSEESFFAAQFAVAFAL